MAKTPPLNLGIMHSCERFQHMSTALCHIANRAEKKHIKMTVKRLCGNKYVKRYKNKNGYAKSYIVKLFSWHSQALAVHTKLFCMIKHHLGHVYGYSRMFSPIGRFTNRVRGRLLLKHSSWKHVALRISHIHKSNLLSFVLRRVCLL